VILPAGNRGFDRCDSSSGSGDKIDTDITNNTNQENRGDEEREADHPRQLIIPDKWKIPVELQMHLAQISRLAITLEELKAMNLCIRSWVRRTC
jgi:hypothetical protein